MPVHVCVMSTACDAHATAGERLCAQRPTRADKHQATTHNRSPDHTSCGVHHPLALLLTMTAMRLAARIVTLLVVVLGASFALAWAWDHSDQQHRVETPVR